MRLMGAQEIRVRLGGISGQRAYQITTRQDFPESIADLAHGKIWHADDHQHNLNGVDADYGAAELLTSHALDQAPHYRFVHVCCRR